MVVAAAAVVDGVVDVAEVSEARSPVDAMAKKVAVVIQSQP